MLEYIETFLSHAHQEKPLVRQVASALARRGIVPWLDENDLPCGEYLQEALKEAISSNAYFVCFLSLDAVHSGWVQSELAVVLNRAEGRLEHIFPVFLDEPRRLVRSCPELKGWLGPDSRVDKLGVPAGPDSDPEWIAERIARTLTHRINLDEARELAIVLEQRSSACRGRPAAAASALERFDGPALVFRPHLGEDCSAKHVIVGDEWERWVSSIRGAMPRPASFTRVVRVSGHAQASVAYLVGTIANRNHGAHVLVFDARRGLTFDHDFSKMTLPLGGGEPNCAVEHPAFSAFEPAARACGRTLSLLVVTEDFVPKIAPHLSRAQPATSVAWVRHGELSRSAQVVELAANVKALVGSIQPARVELYTSLPLVALPIFAGLLSPHELGPLTYMEWDANGQRYWPLPMPTDC